MLWEENWSNWRKPTQAEEETEQTVPLHCLCNFLKHASHCAQSISVFLQLPCTQVYSELHANQSLHGSLSLRGLHVLPVAHQLERTPACCGLPGVGSNGWRVSRD